MPLHPQSAQLIHGDLADDLSRPWEMSMAEARRKVARQVAARAATPAAMSAVSDISLPGPAGSISARVYRPTGTPASGVLVWLHGGAFIYGSVEQSDVLVRALAAASGCVVVSVGYRLAPEHPFPAGVQDCYAAVRWVAEHRAQVGAPGAGLAVAGDSAGGTLTAAVTLLAQERGGPPIDFQALVYPLTWWHQHEPPPGLEAEGAFPSRIERATWHTWLTDLYVGSHDPTDQLVSPLLAPSLAGLPPALVVTAEYDTLREEGERYAMRLIEAGVPVEVHRRSGMVHGFLDSSGVPGIADVAADTVERIGRALRGALHTTAPTSQSHKKAADAVR